MRAQLKVYRQLLEALLGASPGLVAGPHL